MVATLGIKIAHYHAEQTPAKECLVDKVFGTDVDYGSIVKTYARNVRPEGRNCRRINHPFERLSDKEGRVSSLKLLRGHPLLNEATLAAVSQWRYKPFLLNGQPTEAITTLSVGYDFGRFY